MRASGSVAKVGRTLARTSVAGFAPLSASSQRATSSHQTPIAVSPTEERKLAVRTEKSTG
jgi:hypothetical protein